mgnify:CR=1 FL=1|jgi:Protein of unknown function (DUF3485).
MTTPTPAPASPPPPHPAIMAGFRRLAALLVVTALLGLFIGFRLERQGQWLPRVPDQIGAWTAVERPLEDRTAKALGSPRSLGRQYVNLLDDRIETHVIAAESFDAFREPAMCMPGQGFSLTAEMFPDVFGPGKQARAMVLKHDESGTRVLMLFWVQYEDGSTTGLGPLRASAADLMPRLTTGFRAATSGKQAVIVRAYTFVSPTDPKAILARRGLYEVAQGLFKEIEKDGKAWRPGTTKATTGSATQ